MLGSAGPLVLATGGGAVLAESNRRTLHDAGARSDATVVWLAADPTVLAARVGRDPARPLLAGGDPGGVLRQLALEREPAYRDAAHVTVDAGAGLPEQVAERVLMALAGDGVPPDVERGPRCRWPNGATTSSSDPGARHLLAEVLPADTRRVAVVSQPGIPVEVDPGRRAPRVPPGRG